MPLEERESEQIRVVPELFIFRNKVNNIQTKSIYPDIQPEF